MVNSQVCFPNPEAMARFFLNHDIHKDSFGVRAVSLSILRFAYQQCDIDEVERVVNGIIEDLSQSAINPPLEGIKIQVHDYLRRTVTLCGCRFAVYPIPLKKFRVVDEMRLRITLCQHPDLQHLNDESRAMSMITMGFANKTMDEGEIHKKTRMVAEILSQRTEGIGFAESRKIFWRDLEWEKMGGIIKKVILVCSEEIA